MDVVTLFKLNGLNSGAYAGYQWESHAQALSFDSINPSTNQVIASVSSCTHTDYQSIIEHAQQAFQVWRMTPAPIRGDFIRQLSIAFREHQADLATLISLEMGKSKQEAFGEVQELIDIADFAVGQSRMLYGRMMHSERPFHRLYEQWHPYGLVAVITAFNFPVAVWAWNAFIAAICGNVVIWKASSQVPLCAIAVHKICRDVLQRNQWPAVFSLILSNEHAIPSMLATDQRIPLVSFTGSTPVGREIATQVAMRLGRSILELGGNNAMILEASANLALAIPAIVFGAIGTAGQRCTSTRRLFVQRSIYSQVLSRLQHAYAQIKIGDPLDNSVVMGPLINHAAVQHYETVITQIKHAGGKIVSGGHVIRGSGFFVMPTLISGLDNQCHLVQSETFLPILYVMPYDTLDEAIDLQNAVSQGLSSALFTNNLQQAELFLSAIGSDCGIANINVGTSGAEIGGAFGGEKETGGGREAGSDAWKSYMRRQTNTINWGDELPLAQGIRFDME